MVLVTAELSECGVVECEHGVGERRDERVHGVRARPHDEVGRAHERRVFFAVGGPRRKRMGRWKGNAQKECNQKGKAREAMKRKEGRNKAQVDGQGSP